jgi:coproporphyrinogen III oxidase-like Fe-S oxidoreductase
VLIEKLLASYSAHLTRRALAFGDYSPSSPPKADKGKSYLLYVHIPFCESLCPYCSFVRTKIEPSLASDYFDALKKEIEAYHRLGFCFDSIYVGGGTPTILPDKLAQIIDFVKGFWQIKQISVETNPNHLKPEILRILKDVGTNRLSVGVQSFDDRILESIQRLGPYGCGEEIKENLSSVAGMFDTVNVDMIFNFPNQTEEMLLADIEIVKEVKADQITYYPLIVSNHNKKEIAEKCGQINYRQEKRLYRLVVEQLADMYSQESVWCFSNRKGIIDEYIVNHDEYAGVGTGSWGHIDGTMYSNSFHIQQYIGMIQADELPIIACRRFSHLKRMQYHILFKLLGGTVNISDMKEKFGSRFWLYLSGELLFLLITRSISFRDNRIVLTPKGRYYWLILMRTFFSIMDDYRQMRMDLQP